MKTKLTLSIDEDIVAIAHQQAKQKGVSISSMFSGDVIHRQKQLDKAVKPPRLQDVLGLFEGLEIDDSKAGIREAYAKKYLR